MNELINLPPEELGYVAAAVGANSNENPFPKDSKDHFAWEWGWKEYQVDKKASKV